MTSTNGDGAARAMVVARDGSLPGWTSAIAASGDVPAIRPELDDRSLEAALRDTTAVLIDAAVGAPLSIARRVHRIAPGVQISIVAADTALEDLRRAMMFAPGIGEVWLLEPKDVTAELVAKALSVGTSRRRHSVRAATVARTIAKLPRAEERRVVLADRYLAVLLELLPDPVVALDDSDCVLFANPAALRLLDLEPDSATTGDELRALLGPRERDAFDALLAAGKRGTAAATVDLRANGRDAVFDAAIAPITGERPARALLLHDVTDQVAARRQLEELAAELEAQRQELQDQNEELQAQAEELEMQREELQLSTAHSERLAAERAAVLGQIADGVIIVDAAGTLVFANPVAQRLHGSLTMGSALDDWVDPFEILHPDGTPIPGADLPLTRAFRDREVIADAEWLIRRGDGSIVHANGSASPVVDEHGRSLGAVLTLRDVTQQRAREEERERLLRERDEAVEDLTSAIRTRSRFYASMSHELRTPINAIIGYNDLMLGGVYGEPDPEERVALERVQHAATHLLELVNDVLDLSKIEAGKLVVTPEPVMVAALIDDLASTMQPLADSNGVDVRFHARGRCEETFVTDPRRLRQILMNLLSNAIRYGGGKPVDVCCTIANGRLRAEVEDRGPGIPADELEQIFDEFVQATDRVEGGTGLGLAIGRALAHALGGTLTATSTVGVGSTFTLDVPELKEQRA